MNVVDLTIGLLRVRVANAEKTLLRARAAQDHYAEAAAKVALAKAQEQLASYGAEKSGGD
jgi:hypothetical protein